MTRLLSRVYHYLTDDIRELEVSDSSIWIKTHEEEQ
jgi:hypothetical protein